MGIVTIVKEIKEIHPKYIALIRVGNFYRAYGKDAYIISNLFNYKITKEENVDVVGFPKKVIKKVQAGLENKKINYLLIDRRDNYTIDEQQDFKNLNTYDKSFEVAKIYVNNMRRIDKINEYLVERVYEEDLKKVLNYIEEYICNKKNLK